MREFEGAALSARRRYPRVAMRPTDRSLPQGPLSSMLFWFVPAGACTRSDRGPVDRTGRYAAVRFGQAIGAREEAHRSRANARERPRPKRVGRLEPCFDRLRFVTSAFRGPVYPTTRNDGRCGRARDVAQRTPPAKRAAAPVWRMRAPIPADPPVRGACAGVRVPARAGCVVYEHR